MTGAAGDRGESDDGSGGTDAPGPEGDETSTVPCPGCGEELPRDSRFCPHCETPISDEDPVDRPELDGLFDEQPALSAVEGRERRTSGPVMVVAGLAVAVPLAPLGLFLVSTVRPLSVWTAPLVFLGSWLAPAAYLARARAPAEAFTRSLYLVAAGTALIPVGLRIGDEGAASVDLQIAAGTVTAVALVVAGLAAVLGRYIHGQVSGRAGRDFRAVEAGREDRGGADGARPGNVTDDESNAGSVEE